MGADQTNAYLVNSPINGLTSEFSLVFSNSGEAQPAAAIASHVVHLGDINADGQNDIGISYTHDNGATEEGGTLYIFFGGFEPGLNMNVEAANAVIRGTNNAQRFGRIAQGSMSVADVTGDGVPDLLATNDPGGSTVGAYVFAGPIEGNLSTDEAAAVWSGATPSRPHTIASAGDFNGDGFNDVIIGAPDDDGSGAAYLFYGPVAGSLALSSADVVFVGIQANALTGHQVGSPGDVNLDGYSDIVITAPGYSYGDYIHSGAAYLWLGRGE